MGTADYVKPHTLFSVWRPDEVAECIDGIPRELYTKLWSLVEKYDNGYRANIEDIGPSDVIGINNTATWWNDFTPEEQTQLNELATAHEAYIDTLMGAKP